MLELKQPYYDDHLVIQSKKSLHFFNKTLRWVNIWSKWECFEDKPRSGRPSVLTNYARNSIEKAKYKRNKSTRKAAKNLQQKNIEVSSITVWRYITRKGWKAFKRKKIPLLSEKQWKTPLRLAKKHAKPTEEDECPNYLFPSTLFQKTISHGARSGIKLMWCSSNFLSQAECECVGT